MARGTSAPGKVLFLGGYSVLEEGNPALSFAVSDFSGLGVVSRTKPSTCFRLISKGFGIDSEIDIGKRHPESPGLSESALVLALSYLESIGELPKPFELSIENSPIFGGVEGQSKTGLGSSSGTAVSVVASAFLQAGLGIEDNREKIHKIAQIAHFLSKGRKGSGFDVATAAFGTIVYRRFGKNELSGIRDAWDSSSVSIAVGREWGGMEASRFELPEKYGLALFDIAGKGTDTGKNVSVARALAEKRPEKYSKIISAQAGFEEEAINALLKGKDEEFGHLVNLAREESRKIGEEAKNAGLFGFVPVEPAPARKAIDSVLKEGLAIAGRCPGAGGYDGIAFILRKEKRPDPKAIVLAGKNAGIELEPVGIRLASGVQEIKEA